MKKIKLLAIIITVIILLCACDSVGENEETTTEPENLLCIVENSASKYVIIRADEAPSAESECASRLRRSIEDSTGCAITIATDWVKRGEEIKPTEFEILVGNTNRPESEIDLEINEYVIRMDGNKLVIAAGSTEMLSEAVDVFASKYLGSNNLYLPEDLNDSFSALMAIYPENGIQLDSCTPSFSWCDTGSGTTLRVMKATDDEEIVIDENIAEGGNFTVTEALASNTAYKWSVTDGNGTTVEGGTFMTAYIAAENPVNKGLDFTFDGSVSEEVLCNYLSRMLNNTFLSGDNSHLEEDIRIIKSTGAKYIGRACTQWLMGSYEDTLFPYYKETIAALHEYDPEIVFEACVFETTATAIEDIPIPAWVFEAFGLEPETRNFDYESMLFPNGKHHDQWGEGFSVPDMSKLETQMWFYYRGCIFIDMGFEALHMGQVWLMGQRDRNYEKTTMVYNMIRDYAKEHARRHFVFINAHAYNLTGTDGKLLLDFHIFPARGTSPDDAVAHEAVEGDPQKIIFMKNFLDSIYGNSIGGMTHSGWKCDMLPYVVELDNYCGYVPERVDKPSDGSMEWWGYDEISWFANQPLSYKKEWLEYAWNWIRNIDKGRGYLEMPASRIAAIKDTKTGVIEMKTFYANSRLYDPAGFDIEFTIRDIWEKSLNENVK